MWFGHVERKSVQGYVEGLQFQEKCLTLAVPGKMDVLKINK